MARCIPYKKPKNQDLGHILTRFLEVLDKDESVIGGWHFGSISRGLDDAYSDVDLVLYISDSGFDSFDQCLDDDLKKACEQVLAKFAEDFNTDHFKNYCYLLKEAGGVYQFDVFLVREGYEQDYMAKMHRQGCDQTDLLLDRDHRAKEVLLDQAQVKVEKSKLEDLVSAYWFHEHMLQKYVVRADYFKLQLLMHTLFEIHGKLLLHTYQKTTWGGIESLIKHNVPEEKYIALYDYFNPMNLDIIRNSQEKLSEIFWKEAMETAKNLGVKIPRKIEV